MHPSPVTQEDEDIEALNSRASGEQLHVRMESEVNMAAIISSIYKKVSSVSPVKFFFGEDDRQGYNRPHA
jgi:hypothetical protein